MVEQTDSQDTAFGFSGTAEPLSDGDSWQASQGNYQFNFRGDVRQSVRGDAKFTVQTITFTGLPAANVAAANTQVPLFSSTPSESRTAPETDTQASDEIRFPDSFYTAGQTFTYAENSDYDLANFFDPNSFSPEQIHLNLSVTAEGKLQMLLDGLENLPDFDEGDLVLQLVDEEGNVIEVAVAANPQSATPAAAADKQAEETTEKPTTVSASQSTTTSDQSISVMKSEDDSAEMNAMMNDKPENDAPIVETQTINILATPTPISEAPVDIPPPPELAVEQPVNIIKGIGRWLHITGSDERDEIHGDNHHDTLLGSGGDDVLYGHGGRDTLFGGDDNDTLDGGTGNDTLTGGAGSDRFQFSGTQFGYDQIVDYSSEDSIHLLDATEQDIVARFVSEKGKVFFKITLQGQSKWDAGIILAAQPGDVVNVYDANGKRLDIYQTILMVGEHSYNNLSGTDSADEMHGNYHVDTLLGSGGDDVLYGHGGRDTLYGGADDDELRGGDGNDRLDGGAGHDLLDGGRGNDRLTGRAGNDIFVFLGNQFNFNQITDYSSGDVIVLQDLDIDQINTQFYFHRGALKFTIGVEGETKWTASIDLQGATQDDEINIITGNGERVDVDYTLHKYGTHRPDKIIGGDGEDSLHGQRRNDKLYGGDGNDRLYGGAGDDLLDGSAGRDILTGGADNDKFVISFDNLDNLDGPHVITDFGIGHDKLVFDVDDETKQEVESVGLQEAKMAALRAGFLLDWSNDQHVDTGTKTNDAKIADTVVTQDGEVELIIEDYTDDLDFTYFDII